MSTLAVLAGVLHPTFLNHNPTGTRRRQQMIETPPSYLLLSKEISIDDMILSKWTMY
jgi:hypothetical protein